MQLYFNKIRTNIYVLLFRYLATGDSVQTISFSYRVGRSTAQYAIRETCQALWEVLVGDVMKEPDENDWRDVAQKYWSRWNFPNCVGAIDGKHVNIQAPAHSGSLYFNYKGSHSIVLMAAVDANLRFLFVDIGAYGRNSDSSVFAASKFGNAIINGKLNLPPDAALPNSPLEAQKLPHVFLADEAFPLKTCLMRPFSGRGISEERRIFNYRLSRARRCVENAFGILAQRWRIYRRPIIANPQSVCDYIKATCVLHNFVGVSAADISEVNDQIQSGALQSITPVSNRSATNAQQIRQQFCNYFVSNEGGVTWQQDIVTRGK
jgi:hypothetical protein